ncbi:MAG TPA: TonB-dependent receptor plug domain-containing protein [Treponemataceae bacterium]|nr:TonB-dependent receptor plug domain-containing protein [Treponemataceae bacterium]
MKKRLLILWATALCLGLYASDLTVRVTDADLDSPLEGVSVTLLGTASSAKTAADGTATLQVPDGLKKGTITTRMAGYRSASATVSQGQKSVSIGMTIADVLEANELVVERTAVGKTDAKPGVSLVMDKREMSTTAQIGLIEDVMSSIKTLPGVGFTGGWDAMPSVRGGYPDEMGTVLDGIYVLFPYHWGGAYSIFNPSMVSSVKMSHGIFSARYGRAMSGLLEVTTVKPASQFRFNASVGTTSFDCFTEIPLGKNAGVFTGGKVTYLETLALLNPSVTDNIATMPYIRDFYLKSYFTPDPSLDVSFNGFFGSDGICTDQTEKDDDVTTKSKFDYVYYQGFAGLNVKWMPVEKVLFHVLGAYNNNTMDLTFTSSRSGYRKYGDDFIAKIDGTAADPDGTADGLIAGASGYNLTDFAFDVNSRLAEHQMQGKAETDIQVTHDDIVTVGAEEVFQFSHFKEGMNGWSENFTDGIPALKPSGYSLEADGNRGLNTSAFALVTHGTEDSALQGELGFRFEHYYLWNNNFDINTKPVVNPRLSVQWKPVRDTKVFNSITLSAGTGFFSQLPMQVIAASQDLNIDDFEISPNRAWFQVIGSEFAFQNDWTFKIEGYYKRYFNRLYLVEDERTETDEFTVKSNGIGNVYGFDLMLQKKNGRKFDGYLSYSFVYAKYKNPFDPQYDGQLTTDGELLDRWFYPSFHRFHSLNLILNWKPQTGMILTVKSSVATGKPKRKAGEVVAYAATLPDGTVVERYARHDTYDDSLRTSLSCPVDLRFALSGFYPNSKLKWEYYIGAEDIFVNLYRPKANSDFDAFTGDEIQDSDSADFNIGMPLISAGYKISL